MWRKPVAAAAHALRNRKSLRRRLWIESLESRELLASDILGGLAVTVQNDADPFDVDRSGWPVPLDALLIANHLNGVPVSGAALDVNGDGLVSQTDFDAELARLNIGTPAAADTPLSLATGNGDSGGMGRGSAKPSYKYYSVGNSTDCSSCTPTSGGLALVGGGTDVDEVFRWMGAKANNGDFLVLAASGNGAYDSYIKQLVPSLNSVSTLIVPDSTAANDPLVAEKIRNAEAIFFAGGDQADYIHYWSNTTLESALYSAIARNAPVGGTSAGLAILGDYDFAALNGSITSSEALADPYDNRTTLDGGFVNERDYQASNSSPSPLALLNDTITDSHFQQRDRMGRLITFVARLDADGTVPDAAPRGIAVNEQTALLVEPDGTSRVAGNPYSKKLAVSEQQRSVYFLDTHTVASTPLSTPLNYADVQIVRASYDPKLAISDTFNLEDWSGSRVVVKYSISANQGSLTSTQPGGLIY